MAVPEFASCPQVLLRVKEVTFELIMKSSAVIFIVFVVLAILHQDFWNWDNGNLVLGFMPVTLAYHAGYSLVAALFWGLVMKFAWPTELEAWADGEDHPSAASTETASQDSDSRG